MFALVAVSVTVNWVSSLTVWVETVGNDGGTFTSLTITVKVLVAVSIGLTRSKGLLLVTTAVMRVVLGLSVCAGVQVIMPPALTVMPVGGLIRW